MKTYKYNSACEADKHTDMAHIFVLHVARCKICQEKLPPEILKSLEPRLGELKSEIARVAKLEAEGKVESEKKAEAKIKPKPEAKAKEIKEPVQPVDELDARISELPTIKRLAGGIEKIDKALGLVLGMGGALAEDAGKEEVDTPVQQGSQGKVAQAGEGEPVTVTEEMKQEARDIKKESGGASKPVKKAPAQKSVTGANGVVLPDLTQTEAEKMEQYVSQQKQKLGMAGEAPTTEKPGGGGAGGLLGDATGLLGKVVQVLQNIPRKAEVSGMQEMMGELFKGWVASMTSKPDPIDYFIKAVEFVGNVRGGGGSNAGFPSFQDGVNMTNTSMANAIKIFRGGKADIVGPESSADALDHRIDSRIQKATGGGPPKTEGDALT